MHYVERGNPYALLFHKGIDFARGRNGAEGIRGNKKRMAHCNGEHRGSKFALARKGADLFQVFHGKMGGIPVNDLYSTTEGKTSEKQSDEAKLGAQWKSIDWRRAEREVNRLQVRIVKATQQNDYNAVKRLQYLLTHSFYAKALAVKRVVTNDGRRTPGVDGVLWNTPAKKMKAVLSLTDKGYRARPLRRVYIEKKDKKKNVHWASPPCTTVLCRLSTLWRWSLLRKQRQMGNPLVSEKEGVRRMPVNISSRRSHANTSLRNGFWKVTSRAVLTTLAMIGCWQISQWIRAS